MPIELRVNVLRKTYGEGDADPSDAAGNHIGMCHIEMTGFDKPLGEDL